MSEVSFVIFNIFGLIGVLLYLESADDTVPKFTITLSGISTSISACNLKRLIEPSYSR